MAQYQSILPGGGGGNNPRLNRVLGNKSNPFAGDFTPGQYAGEVGPPPAPKAAPQAPPKQAGPTGFWQRISQVGIGKVNALNAYRAVAHSGAPVQANNQPLRTAKKATVSAGKFIGRTATTGEQKFAQGAARVLPGGTADIQAQEEASRQASQQMKQAHDLYQSGKISKPQFIKMAKTAAGNSSMSNRELHDTIKAMPTQGEILAGAAATILDMTGAGRIIEQGGKYTLEKGAQKGILKKAAGALGTRKGTAAISAADAAAHTTAGGGTTKQKLENAAVGGVIPYGSTIVSGGRKIISSFTGKLINRNDAKAAQNLAQDVLTKHNLDDLTKTTKAAVRDESAPTRVNVNRPNAPKLLTSGEKSTVKGEGFTMAPQADPRMQKLSMRLNQINNRLDKVAKGKSFMHPDEVKSLANEKANIYREANGATIPREHADRLAKDIQANGGTTATIHGEEPTSGYAFAPHKDTERIIPVNEFKSSHIQDYVNANHDKLSQPGAHLGAWVEGDKVYLDVSHVGPASAETLSKAQKAQQLAAFDLEHYKEIPLGKIDKNGYTVHDEASTIHTAHQREVSGANPPRGAEPIAQETGQREQLAGAAKKTAPAQAAAAERGATAELTQRLRKPTTPKKETPLVNTNRPAAGGVSGAQERAARKLHISGAVNPEQAAARAGNTEFARSIRNASARDEMAQHTGHVKGEEFERRYHGAPESATAGAHTPGKGAQFIHEIEQGTGTHEAHQYFKQTLSDTGKRLEQHGLIKGARDETYVPRYARFRDDSGAAQIGGLRKTGGFSKGRVQAGEFGEGGDKYKTHAEFSEAVAKSGGKTADNPVDIFRHTVTTRERAIAHEQSLQELERTPMRDGNPALITFNQSKGLPVKYQQLGYDTSVLPGRAVHPEAVQGVKALTKNFTDNPAFGAFAAVNSKAKRLVTINGVVHAKNFVLASVRKQGIYNTAKSLFDLRRSGFAEEDVSRAIQHGWVPFEGAKMSLFDEANRGDGMLGKAMTPLGKLRQASDKVLFDGIGNRLSMSTFLKTERAALKANLSPEEAGVIAARAAKQVSFISSASESSQAYREISRVAFFAGQFLKSTLKEGATAAGLSRDQTLTKAAQTFEQRRAARNLIRGFMYLFTGAQALNMATTGHPTWQNKDSKLSPVFHVDPKTGKEYHLTNFYGQIGELLNLNRPSTMINKLSPGIQAGSQIIANYQQFKGKQVYDKNASGPRQMLTIFKTALQRILTPAGIDTADAQKYFGPTGQPGKVTGAQLLGYGTSTKDQNAMERDIIQRRNNALPATSPPANPQLSALKSAAKNDLRSGKTSSPNLDQLKSKISEKDYKAFVKTGGQSDVQAAFDKLSTEQKLQVIEKYNKKQLSELDLTSAAKALVDSNAKSTYQSLKAKGYSDQQIQADLKKAGFEGGQLYQLKQAAKAEARQRSRAARGAPKWQNPLLTGQ